MNNTYKILKEIQVKEEQSHVRLKTTTLIGSGNSDLSRSKPCCVKGVNHHGEKIVIGVDINGAFGTKNRENAEADRHRPPPKNKVQASPLAKEDARKNKRYSPLRIEAFAFWAWIEKCNGQITEREDKKMLDTKNEQK